MDNGNTNVALVLGIFVGLVMSFLIVASSNDLVSKNVIAECESQLPRHKNCKLIAVVEEE